MLTAVERQNVSRSRFYCDGTPRSVELARRHELTELMVREKRYFVRVAISILHNQEDAEDAVHSAFCSAWKALGSFRGEASMKTWFARIVSNHGIVALKKLRRDRQVSFDENSESLQCFEMDVRFIAEDPETAFRRHEELSLLHKHIGQLPKETGIVVRLYLSGEGSPDAIARLRGKSRASIAAHLQRGKTMLRRSIHGTRFSKDQ